MTLQVNENAAWEAERDVIVIDENAFFSIMRQIYELQKNSKIA